MGNILNCMKENGHNVYIKYYGSNDLGTEHDLKHIIEGKDVLKDYYKKKKYEDEFDFNDYVDYLIMEKIINMEEMIPLIMGSKNQEIMRGIIDGLEGIYNKIDFGKQIKFINTNIEEIFSNIEDYYDIGKVTLEKIISFQSGIDEEVFIYLIRNHFFIVIDNYENLQKIIEKNEKIARVFFDENILRKNIIYRLEVICEIVISVSRRKGKGFQNLLQNAVKIILDYGEEVIDKLNENNIMRHHNIVKCIYRFTQELKLLEANKFEKYMEEADKLLGDHLNENGLTIELDSKLQDSIKELIDERIKDLKSDISWQLKLLILTHEKSIGNMDSILNQPPKREEASILDYVSTNIDTDEYFTFSHRDRLEISMRLGSTILYKALRDKKAFDELHSSFYMAFNYITDELSYDREDILDDLGLLFVMLEKLFIESENVDKYDRQSQSYGLSMFICALTEKILRITYKYIQQDEEYVSSQRGTMGSYINPNNKVMSRVLGDYQIKHLQFYFLQTDDSKIGFNYRNKLAHWNGIFNNECNEILVCRLFFLFLNVFNSILCYLFKESEE
ncbi:MAG: hypothetical protein M0Q14_10390 [Tissierellaceae bacterium]|nr:hypothetical protein [Tissierellaceae bacterium]